MKIAKIIGGLMIAIPTIGFVILLWNAAGGVATFVMLGLVLWVAIGSALFAGIDK